MKNNQNYDSSVSAEEESKKSSSFNKNRRAKQIADRRITRKAFKRGKRQKIDEDENDEYEVEIPKEYGLEWII